MELSYLLHKLNEVGNIERNDYPLIRPIRISSSCIESVGGFEGRERKNINVKQPWFMIEPITSTPDEYIYAASKRIRSPEDDEQAYRNAKRMVLARPTNFVSDLQAKESGRSGWLENELTRELTQSRPSSSGRESRATDGVAAESETPPDRPREPEPRSVAVDPPASDVSAPHAHSPPPPSPPPAPPTDQDQSISRDEESFPPPPSPSQSPPPSSPTTRSPSHASPTIPPPPPPPIPPPTVDPPVAEKDEARAPSSRTQNSESASRLSSLSENLLNDIRNFKFTRNANTTVSGDRSVTSIGRTSDTLRYMNERRAKLGFDDATATSSLNLSDMLARAAASRNINGLSENESSSSDDDDNNSNSTIDNDFQL